MVHEDAARQYSFRLPQELIARLEHCTEHLRREGLDVTRTDVVRLLLKHALDTTQCNIRRLLGRTSRSGRLRT